MEVGRASVVFINDGNNHGWAANGTAETRCDNDRSVKQNWSDVTATTCNEYGIRDRDEPQKYRKCYLDTLQWMRKDTEAIDAVLEACPNQSHVRKMIQHFRGRLKKGTLKTDSTQVELLKWVGDQQAEKASKRAHELVDPRTGVEKASEEKLAMLRWMLSEFERVVTALCVDDMEDSTMRSFLEWSAKYGAGTQMLPSSLDGGEPSDTMQQFKEHLMQKYVQKLVVRVEVIPRRHVCDCGSQHTKCRATCNMGKPSHRLQGSASTTYHQHQSQSKPTNLHTASVFRCS